MKRIDNFFDNVLDDVFVYTLCVLMFFLICTPFVILGWWISLLF